MHPDEKSPVESFFSFLCLKKDTEKIQNLTEAQDVDKITYKNECSTGSNNNLRSTYRFRS